MTIEITTEVEVDSWEENLAMPGSPTELEYPAFLLNPPFSFSTAVPNNAWMDELSAQERVPDGKRAMAQFMALYRYLSFESLVFTLPTPYKNNLQDLVYTANLGIVLDHLPDKNTV